MAKARTMLKAQLLPGMLGRGLSQETHQGKQGKAAIWMGLLLGSKMEQTAISGMPDTSSTSSWR